MTEELKPCPFCGEHAETDFIPDHDSYRIECSVLNCATGPIRDSEAEAIRDWNDRATPAPAQPDPLHVANERGEGWQPIETAPTDRYILVCSSWGEIDVSIKYEGQTAFHGGNGCAIHPAHWMPLPAAPKEKP